MAKGRPHNYTGEELAWIEARKHLPREVLHLGFQITFDRYEVSKGAICNLCKRNGWLTGRDGRIQKGNVPANKGRKGYIAPGCEKGWFKKGSRPVNKLEVGEESIDRDGYVKLCVAETNPHTGATTRMVFKHRWLWEQENGPVPANHALKCLDGDKTNTDPSNWRAIPRGMLPRLNGRWNGLKYDEAPAELKPVILAAAELDYKARQARRANQS